MSPTEVPENDGPAAHLEGTRMPSLGLAASDGSSFPVDRAPAGFSRLVLYVYPRTGRPGAAPLTPDWDQIPGAPGCTAESCGFRDHAADLAQAGAAVAGVSTQDTAYQAEAVERLRLPFPLLSDADLRLADALRLPTFHAGGQVLLRRLTLAVRRGVIEEGLLPRVPARGSRRGSPPAAAREESAPVIRFHRTMRQTAKLALSTNCYFRAQRPSHSRGIATDPLWPAHT